MRQHPTSEAAHSPASPCMPVRRRLQKAQAPVVSIWVVLPTCVILVFNLSVCCRAVGQNEECLISIRNTDSTSSGEHKVRLCSMVEIVRPQMFETACMYTVSRLSACLPVCNSQVHLSLIPQLRFTTLNPSYVSHAVQGGLVPGDEPPPVSGAVVQPHRRAEGAARAQPTPQGAFAMDNILQFGLCRWVDNVSTRNRSLQHITQPQWHSGRCCMG